MLLELRDETGLGLFFLLFVLGLFFLLLCFMMRKLLFFIIKCGNLLVLRSPGLECGENPGVGSAQLSWPGPT